MKVNLCNYINCSSINVHFLGAGTYTVSSRVFPSEVIRQGIGQDNPCPGDRVVFTCTRSESSPTAVRWTANGTPLYTFGIPSDLGTPRANQDAGFPGLVGTLVDATMFTLLVDLTLATDIINGTAVACGEVISGVTSPIFTLFIIGKAVSAIGRSGGVLRLSDYGRKKLPLQYVIDAQSILFAIICNYR